ncbi:hypothetical protein [Streptomyces poonensis]|uniref:Uncharacterized protein n=1 Tax=Streptomyces poonensis TaxID=68255 RepID=A0A918PJ73_9ACTN|nr:hypothetical protein [Streptomyces poonensis]GGZ12813.1 hypothetical protein GCM10010365_35640 [Streptomyces poonensis]GLJ91981.1 hypothetical protein GCM10017589_45890 [Streptomyces poonensis]
MAYATHMAGPHRALPPGTSPTPDVFGERTHRIMHWAVPVVLGLLYGYWVAALDRDAGPITGGNMLLGWLSALAFVVLYAAARALAHRLKREPHALTWAVFAGLAFGFLYSQNGGTVVRASGLSLLVAVGVFAVAWYRYPLHGNAEGRRI